MVPLVPKLAVMTPSRVLPVPIAPIMLSPPPALTRTLAVRPNSLAVTGLQASHWAVARDQRWQLAGEVRVNRLEGSEGPAAFAHIHERRAAGVAVFHHSLAREPEIEIVMRQQDRSEFAEILRLILL